MVQDRILEIVVLLMNHLEEHQGSLGNIDDMSENLRSLGFTDSEISTAYNWLFKQLENAPDNFNFSERGGKTPAVRVLSGAERKVFEPDAYGYLLQLQHLGLLNTEQFESIIDKGMVLGASPIDIDEAKFLVSGVLFDAPAVDFLSSDWFTDLESEPIN
jgi:uncharacterized protein Smg (DUF494 family)